MGLSFDLIFLHFHYILFLCRFVINSISSYAENVLQIQMLKPEELKCLTDATVKASHSFFSFLKETRTTGNLPLLFVALGHISRLASYKKADIVKAVDVLCGFIFFFF